MTRVARAVWRGIVAAGRRLVRSIWPYVLAGGAVGVHDVLDDNPAIVSQALAVVPIVWLGGCVHDRFEWKRRSKRAAQVIAESDARMAELDREHAERMAAIDQEREAWRQRSEQRERHRCGICGTVGSHAPTCVLWRAGGPAPHG